MYCAVKKIGLLKMASSPSSASLSPGRRAISPSRTPPKSSSKQLLETLDPATPAAKTSAALTRRFWGWGAATFVLVAGLLLAALGLGNPELTQDLTPDGLPSGDLDWVKAVGASVVGGVLGFTIYILVVLGRAKQLPRLA
jgi:hypothetical protein